MKKKDNYITCTKKQQIKKEYNLIDDFITFILLCDMPGHRMKSYGSTSLINIDDNRLIDKQIQQIVEKFKNYEIIICSGFDSNNLSKYIQNKHKNKNIRIVENQLFEQSNSCESLRLCLNNITNNKVFILDGSLLFKSSIFENIDINETFLFIENDPCENLEIGVNINNNGSVEHFSFGAKNIWSEIIFIDNKETVNCLRKLLYNSEYKTKLLFEIFNDLISLKHKINYIYNNSPIKKINNIKTYKIFRKSI